MIDPILPTEEEKRRSIDAILNAGLPRRRRLRDLPLSMLFFGVGDCLFLALLITGVCFIPLVVAAQKAPLAPLLFLLSPLLYASLQYLMMWKEAMSGTLEWKQTCRVSFRMLIALRMLIFGGASVAVCVPANILLWELSRRQAALPWMLGLSFSSLFLYAALSLTCQRSRRRAAILAPSLLWLALGIVLFRWKQAALFLTCVPALVFFLLAFGGLALFLLELKNHLACPMEGGLYAIR